MENNTNEIKKTNKTNSWKIATVVLGILLIVSIFSNFFDFGLKGMTGSAVATNTIDFINNNLLSPGTTAELKNVSEESGVYKATLDISGQETDVYITKDSKMLFVNAIDLTETIPTSTTPQQQEEIPTADKPTIDLFVMSFCPYGNRAEDTMLPVYELLKNKLNWNIHYIVSANGDTITSLHGQKEVDQDIREVCVLNKYGLDKFWQFITYVDDNCGSDGSCWEDAAKEASIDVSKVQTCFDEQGLSLMKNEAQITEENGVSGSPTLIINGVRSSTVYQYGNTEAYKQVICDSFNNAPEECAEALTSSTTTTTTTGGSC